MAALDSAVLYSNRANIKDAIRQELKSIGVKEIKTPMGADECIEMLFADSTSLFVVDWEVGGKEVVMILGAIRGKFRVETRPIFLVAADMTNEIIATAYEYGVSKVHTGEISPAKIKQSLSEMVKDEVIAGPLRAAFVKVADARARGEWSVVTPVLEDLRSKLPDNPRVTCELAENYIFEKRWEDAEKLLEPMTQTAPPYLRGVNLYGRCLMKMGKFAEACGALEQAKIFNPLNPDRLVDLGNALLQIDRPKDARMNFEEAADIDKGRKDVQVGLGTCKLLEGDVNDALTLLREVSGDREMASIFNMSAIIAMRNGRFGEGMSLYDSAITALGKDEKLLSRLMFNKGVGFKRQNMADEAAKCLKEAIRLDPSFEKASSVLSSMTGEEGGARPPAPSPIPSSDLSAPGIIDSEGEEETHIAEERVAPEAPSPSSDLSFTDQFAEDDFDFDVDND